MRRDDSHMVKSTGILRQLSYNYEILEHSFYNKSTGRTTKHDFKGFGDVEAYSPRQKGVALMIQVCGEDVSEHTTRYKDPREKRGRQRIPICESIRSWIECGFAFQIWSWRKSGNLIRFDCVIENGELSFPMIDESRSNLGKGVLV